MTTTTHAGTDPQRRVGPPPRAPQHPARWLLPVVATTDPPTAHTDSAHTGSAETGAAHAECTHDTPPGGEPSGRDDAVGHDGEAAAVTVGPAASLRRPAPTPAAAPPRQRRTGPLRTREELEAIAAEAGERLEDAGALEILAWAGEVFGDRVAVTSAMADLVVPHLAARAIPGVDVLFLDTGYHFAETIGTRDAAKTLPGMRIVTVRAELSVAEQDAIYGPRLYERDPDRCCFLRKVKPLEGALTGYEAWITGLRRDESPTRADTPVVSFDPKRGKVKICPIARWSDDDVDRYIADHGVLINPLLTDGYPSIGCEPCTARVAEGADPRSGRWAGLAKTECGLHS